MANRNITKRLRRFRDAQADTYETALAEIRNGRKESHWMWFIFPQIAGLGYSSMAQYYAIADLAEAEGYMKDTLLRKRLLEISGALLELESDDAVEVMGYPDDLKLKSCMTLFEAATPKEAVFGKVLEKFFKGERDERTLEKISIITRFRGEFDFLSNFYEVPVEYEGIVYGSSEAAFQAQKCEWQEDKLAIAGMRPMDSKKAGREVPLRTDWDEVKLRIMEELVRAKFMQNPELAEKLIATGDREIREGNNWHDTFWGVDSKTGEGENHLGKILMMVREELRKDHI